MSRITLFECNKCSVREDEDICSEWHIDKNNFSLCEVCVRSISRASSDVPVTSSVSRCSSVQVAPSEDVECVAFDCSNATSHGNIYCDSCLWE